MDNTVEDFKVVAKTHRQHGVTMLYPTTVASDINSILEITKTLSKARHTTGGSKLGGLHIEGPYCSKEQCGALDPEKLKNPDPNEYAKILEHSENIARWTIAPELPGGLLLAKSMIKKGIKPCIGHTQATYNETLAAFDAGCTHITHLYSCMPQGIRRNNAYRVGGVLEAAYLLPEMTVEIIADGSHLPSELLSLVLKIKGADKTALVTDSMRAAGTDALISRLGNRHDGLEVIIEDNVAKLPDRSAFAGSVATADKLIRTMLSQTDISLIRAIKMMTVTPAKIAGIDHKYGLLRVGAIADLAIFNEQIDIFATIIDGNIYT